MNFTRSPTISRRTFMAGVAGVLAAPLTAEAQPAGKVWRIGLIAVAPASPMDALSQGLRELGYVEGQNLIIERRYSEGRAERFSEFAAELARRWAQFNPRSEAGFISL